MHLAAEIIVWLNRLMNTLSRPLTGFMASLPGWLSLTIISAVVGLLAMAAFKYTSNQEAIGRVRNRIKAQLLALKLFKDNIPVVLKAQGRILTNSVLLFVHSLRPTLVILW